MELTVNKRKHKCDGCVRWSCTWAAAATKWNERSHLMRRCVCSQLRWNIHINIGGSVERQLTASNSPYAMEWIENDEGPRGREGERQRDREDREHTESKTKTYRFGFITQFTSPKRKTRPYKLRHLINEFLDRMRYVQLASAAAAALSLHRSHRCHMYLCVAFFVSAFLPLSLFTPSLHWQLGISFRFSEHLHH